MESIDECMPDPYEVEMAERIIDRGRELVPGDGWSHAVTLKIYASSRKWDQIIEMRGILRELGLKMDRSMIWIHVDRKVHTFLAGDLSHPDIPKILETLVELIQRTRSLGTPIKTSTTRNKKNCCITTVTN
ncbi:hypothetical protein MLD38_031347 [Melastoma candidum]|uniref:Uncharacterized protein n=1 Tax=Melastoma candidum TaxID=119954 RepID=A0ACB9MPD6_9MYRT|nr:hypothetical protein MLD38_031347 [Melastoma candidum]